jgi:hypothetical protein
MTRSSVTRSCLRWNIYADSCLGFGVKEERGEKGGGGTEVTTVSKYAVGSQSRARDQTQYDMWKMAVVWVSMTGMILFTTGLRS